MSNAEQAPVPQPTQGGSYTLNPEIGELVRVAYTRTQAEVAEAEAAAAAAAATPQPE